MNVSNVTYKERVMQKMKAAGLLKRSNKKLYAKLMPSIREQFYFKINVYPKTLNDASNLLVFHYKEVKLTNNESDKKYRNRSNTSRNNENMEDGSESENGDVNGLQYAHDGEVVSGRDGLVYENIKCFVYNKKGHYTDQCPNVEVETQHNQADDENEATTNVENGSQQYIEANDINDVDSCKSSDESECAIEFCFPMNEKCNRDAILLDTGST